MAKIKSVKALIIILTAVFAITLSSPAEGENEPGTGIYSTQLQSVIKQGYLPGVIGNYNEELISSECGTVVTPEQVAFELALREKGGYGELPEKDGYYYVPISLHIVRRSDGSGGNLSPDDIDIRFPL